MNHGQPVSYYSKCELSTIRSLTWSYENFIRLWTGDWLLFRALKSVEHFSIDVSICIEVSSINTCPIKPYPIKA